jgi:heme-degrading monooxygenase HmoA
MHVRVTQITGATDIESGVAVLRDQVVPELQQQKGYRGLSASGDHSNGRLTVLSVWETAADLEASESTADKVRDDAMKVIGGEARVERYEQTVWETGAPPPSPGARLHIRHISMDPALIEENLAYFRDTVLPQMKATPGFLGVRQLIDRTTGEGRVGTIWAGDEALEESLRRAEGRRADAAQRGIRFGEQEVAEIFFSSMPS